MGWGQRGRQPGLGVLRSRVDRPLLPGRMNVLAKMALRLVVIGVLALMWLHWTGLRAATEEGFEKVQAAAREAKEQARGEAYNQPDLRTGNEM